jgi:hypothetical protein
MPLLPKPRHVSIANSAAAGSETPDSTSDSENSEQPSDGTGESIPLVCQDWANTKAAYRFLSDHHVTETDILAGRSPINIRTIRGLGGPCFDPLTITLIPSSNAAAGSQTVQVIVFLISGNGTLGNIPTAGVNPNSLTFRVKASTVIQFSTTYSNLAGCSPAPTYQLYPVLEQLTAN